MSDTGGLSKAAKKNKKKNERKKKVSGAAASGTEQRPRTAADLLPILKHDLEAAKEAKDHAQASKLREQIWVLKDMVNGVKTDMPKADLEPIIMTLKAKFDGQESSTSTSKPDTLDPEKRIRNLRKKLTSIEALKEKQAKGEKLEQGQLKKIEGESQIYDEIRDLEQVVEVAVGYIKE